jgi:hypothetical protein
MVQPFALPKKLHPFRWFRIHGVLELFQSS